MFSLVSVRGYIDSGKQKTADDSVNRTEHFCQFTEPICIKVW
jgi:hypothetical protein